MRTETFYIILDGNYKLASGTYPESEIALAKQKLKDLAITNPGNKYHLVRRLSSAVANTLAFEDSF